MRTTLLASLVAVTALRGTMSAQSVDVRFELGSPARPVILVPVLVNGQGPYQFALDTGASRSVCTARIAQELGIQGTGTQEAMGAGGRVSVSSARLGSLAVGEARVDSLDVVITDLAAIAQAAGTRLDGILGQDFLRRFTVTIDYRHTTLRLVRAE